MKKTILAIAAILVTTGVAAANDISSRYVYGDAAPRINAPVEPRGLGYPSTTFSIMPTHNNGGDWNDRYGDRAPASVIMKAPNAVDYSAASSIGAAGPRHSLSVSPRILDGSN
ncbi:MAG: hypothetical protein WBA88_17875 [Pseudaminobacter sp.]